MPEEKSKTPQQVRDDFVAHLSQTLTPEELDRCLHIADKLWDFLPSQPQALNAFALVNAEFTVLHSEGELLGPEIAKPALLIVKP